jgi:hypothetical protein
MNNRTRHADIERSIVAACHDVDAGLHSEILAQMRALVSRPELRSHVSVILSERSADARIHSAEARNDRCLRLNCFPLARG